MQHQPLVTKRCAGAALTAILLTTTSFTMAQSAGNPKGSVTPPETSAPKPVAASGARSRDGAGASAQYSDTEAQARARIQGAKPPGGGTEGGLARQGASASEGRDGSRSDKGSAAPRPVPGSR